MARLADRLRPAREAAQQHALLAAHAAHAEHRLQQADDPLVAGQRQRRLRLRRRAVAQQRQRPTVLNDLPDSGQPGVDLTTLDPQFAQGGSTSRYRIWAEVPLNTGKMAYFARTVLLSPNTVGVPWRTLHTERGITTR